MTETIQALLELKVVILKKRATHWAEYGREALKLLPPNLWPEYVSWLEANPDEAQIYQNDFHDSVPRFLAERQS